MARSTTFPRNSDDALRSMSRLSKPAIPRWSGAVNATSTSRISSGSDHLFQTTTTSVKLIELGATTWLSAESRRGASQLSETGPRESRQ